MRRQRHVGVSRARQHDAHHRRPEDVLVLAPAACGRAAARSAPSTTTSAASTQRRSRCAAASSTRRGRYAAQGVALTCRQPDSAWAWRFTLLLGEVQPQRTRAGRSCAALLERRLPAGADFDLLRARQQFLLARPAARRASARTRPPPSNRPAHGTPPATATLQFDIDVLAGQSGARNSASGGRGESGLTTSDRGRSRRAIATIRPWRSSTSAYGQLVRNRYDAALPWLERVLSFDTISTAPRSTPTR